MSEPTILRCACCGLPFARLQDGCIMVASRHHGEVHYNAVAVDELVKLRQGGAPDGSVLASGLSDLRQGDRARRDR